MIQNLNSEKFMKKLICQKIKDLSSQMAACQGAKRLNCI